MTDLQRWIRDLESELGIDAGTVDLKLVLDLARDAAHAVERPAAPVTTYAVGYAAGLAAARGDVSDAPRQAAGLASRWAKQS